MGFRCTILGHDGVAPVYALTSKPSKFQTQMWLKLVWVARPLMLANLLVSPTYLECIEASNSGEGVMLRTKARLQP